ncbi:hypothetical protein REPUB_Repub09cG0174600 [Reevesia pubescens]
MDLMIPKAQPYFSAGADQKVMNVNNPEEKDSQTTNPVTSQLQIINPQLTLPLKPWTKKLCLGVSVITSAKTKSKVLFRLWLALAAQDKLKKSGWNWVMLSLAPESKTKNPQSMRLLQMPQMNIKYLL